MDFFWAVQLQWRHTWRLPTPDVYTDMNGLICNPGLRVIIPLRHDSVPAGPRALADIRGGDQRVPEPPGPPADRAGQTGRGAGQREEVPKGEGLVVLPSRLAGNL